MSQNKNAGFSRRDFLRGMSAMGLTAALAACAPAASPSGDSGSDSGSEEAKVIDFWIFWGQPGRIADQLLATPELEDLLSGNTLDFKTGVDQEARITAVAGGTPPSIGALGSYLDFMSRGVVIPLTDYIETSDIVSPEKFIDGNWNVIQYQGVVYGIPAIECFVRRGLSYNTRMVGEAGLDPDNPPVTWDELFAWHETLTKFDDAGNLIQIGIDPFDAEGGSAAGNDGWFSMESWDINWFNEDTKEFNFDNEAMAQSYEVMGEFVKLIGPDNLVGMRGVEGQGSWGGAYNAEVQAMIIEGYWHPGETANEKPEVSEVTTATWVPVPEAHRGTKIQFGGGHMVQIFKDGTYKDEAWPVAEWLQSTSVCDLFFQQIGWLPAYKSYFDEADPNTFPGLKFYFDSVNEANYWGAFVRNEIQSFIGEKHRDFREAVYRGEMTGAEAAAKLQEEAEKEWDAAGFG